MIAVLASHNNSGQNLVGSDTMQGRKNILGGRNPQIKFSSPHELVYFKRSNGVEMCISALNTYTCFRNTFTLVSQRHLDVRNHCSDVILNTHAPRTSLHTTVDHSNCPQFTLRTHNFCRMNPSSIKNVVLFANSSYRPT